MKRLYHKIYLIVPWKIWHYLGELKRCLTKKEYFFRNYILRKYITIEPKERICKKHGSYEAVCELPDIDKVGKCLVESSCKKCLKEFMEEIN